MNNIPIIKNNSTQPKNILTLIFLQNCAQNNIFFQDIVLKRVIYLIANILAPPSAILLTSYFHTVYSHALFPGEIEFCRV